MNVDSLMRAVGVRRWHTEPQIGEETDGHHSCVVALVADYLAENEDMALAERYYMVREALRHDLGEYWSGDLPAPAKKALSAELLAALVLAESSFKYTKLGFSSTPLLECAMQILGLADTLAAAVHCARQALMGNREGVRILRLLCDYIKDHLSSSCTLRVSTQLNAVQLLRECVMIADSDVLLIPVNSMEERIHAKNQTA